ncbi:hypothetical protein ABID97_004212 [Variovorax sp. OAS795]
MSLSSSKRARRDLLLAWRAFGFWRDHSSSFFRALAWASSLFCSWRQAFALLLEPGAVVALPGNAAAAVHFQDPLGRVVQEVAIVGDGHHGAGEALKEHFEPLHRFRVQVVGRFVEQQHVGLGQQEAAQRHAPLFAA